jgi:hypothetical protein
MHDSDTDAIQIQERLLRLLIFIILNLIVLRYISGIGLSDYDQIKITGISTLIFMFVNTYYPHVVTL